MIVAAAPLEPCVASSCARSTSTSSSPFIASTSPLSSRADGREAEPAAAAERLGLSGRDDLRPEVADRRLERGLLPGDAADDHAVDADGRELLDLVRGERPAADLDQRLRTALGGLAEPLGLAAGEDDRLH